MGRKLYVCLWSAVAPGPLLGAGLRLRDQDGLAALARASEANRQRILGMLEHARSRN
jgi:hypothetical protein